MEKLFALSNIKLQKNTDNDGTVYFAYTDDSINKNVIIEFYGVATAENDEVYEEMAIFAYLREDDTVYQYTLFVTSEVYGAVPAHGIISTAFRFIESCNADTLVSDLKQISTYQTIYDETSEHKQYYKDLLWKYDSVLIHAKEK